MNCSPVKPLEARSATALLGNTESVFARESQLSEKVGSKIRCNVCERRCLLKPGGFGWCRTRVHRNGRLLTLIYGAVSSLAVNPIEKKPFYHFRPGTSALTAGSWSCNFGCPWCQNWDISKTPPPVRGPYVSPERFVQLAAGSACQGTSISFNEPTLSLEWSLDVFRLARRRGLYNTFVTNGYMTPESLSLLIDAGLDAMNVDMKGDAEAGRKYCKTIDVEKVWTACQLARSRGVHMEVTTLVIPGVNDSDTTLRAIAGRIATVLGRDVPWHLTRYYPAYQFSAPPTTLRTLEHAWQIGKEAGLAFVYMGNVPGDPHDDTYCPSCGERLIRRHGFGVVENKLGAGFCPRCEFAIAGVWNVDR
jgi:pyruvate formate lyase activating enzyme